jgi:HD superfamily phosphohydrolase
LKSKIINDPVHGFITINQPLVFALIEHPWYQRLRRIQQMALAELVYPGAVHTRLHHSLGAYHLMHVALNELRTKGVFISEAEELGAKAAILLHDIGHGPFSHGLEHMLLPGLHHEEIGLQLMHRLNDRLGGALDLAIDIFTDKYPRKFLHQLISGQLDVDRLDYLTRDSFFSGVTEGVIGYDRILKMLTVHKEQLVVEEKGIYSVEKFLIARRQMYWQVYLHKTVLGAEKMLVQLMKRVRHLYQPEDRKLKTGSVLDKFLAMNQAEMTDETLEWFTQMDDADVLHAVKVWSSHPDKVLSFLCRSLLNRRLFRTQLTGAPASPERIAQERLNAAQALQLSEDDADWLVLHGDTRNTTYKPGDEQICILMKDGTTKDISEVDNPLIHQTLHVAVKKFYFCTPRLY